MHDGDELSSEMGLDVMGHMFYSGGDGVLDSKWGTNDNIKAFNLEVGLV